jgi:hypothetical protein
MPCTRPFASLRLCVGGGVGGLCVFGWAGGSAPLRLWFSGGRVAFVNALVPLCLRGCDAGGLAGFCPFSVPSVPLWFRWVAGTCNVRTFNVPTFARAVQCDGGDDLHHRLPAQLLLHLRHAGDGRGRAAARHRGPPGEPRDLGGGLPQGARLPRAGERPRTACCTRCSAPPGALRAGALGRAFERLAAELEAVRDARAARRALLPGERHQGPDEPRRVGVLEALRRLHDHLRRPVLARGARGHAPQPRRQRHNAPWDLVNARLIVFWGKNAAETNVHQMRFVEQAVDRGARVVVIDPRRTQTAERARSCWSRSGPAPTGRSPSSSRTC